MTKPQNLAEALAGKPPANLDTDTLEQIRAAGARLGSFDQGDITVNRFSGRSPWERHVDGDELFHVLDGEVEVTLLGKDDSTRVTLPERSIFVIPRGTWHRADARRVVTLLTLRGSDHGPVSFAEDPRVEEQREG